MLLADVNTDSLNSVLDNATGPARVDVLLQLAYGSYPQISSEQIAYGEEALSLARLLHYRDGELSALRKLSVMHKTAGHYDVSEQYLDTYIAICEASGDDANRAWAENIQGLCYRDIGDFEAAIKSYSAALSYYQQQGPPLSQAHVLVNLAIVYNMIGEFNESLTYNEQALEIHRFLKNPPGVAKCLNNIGIIYKDKGYYEIALDYLLQALQLKEELNDRSGIANTMHNIGIIYRNLSQYEKAEEYYLQSLEVKKELGNTRGIAASYNNLGVVYDFLGDYEQALSYHEKSLQLKRQLNMTKGIAVSLNNMGKVYLQLQRFDDAEKCLVEALRIKEENSNNKAIAETLNHLGNLYMQTKRYDLAETSLKRCEALCEELELRDRLQFNYSLQSDLYGVTNRLNEALKYCNKALKIKDEIFNSKSVNKLSELQTMYETKKKQQEIDILSRDNLIAQMQIEQQKLVRNLLIAILLIILFFGIVLYFRYKMQVGMMQKLRDLNATKDKLFSIIAHDLRSPFSAQVAGTNLLMKYVDEMNRDEIKDIAGDMQRNTKRLLELLNNLLSWAKIQQNMIKPQLKDVNLNALVYKQISVTQESINRKEITVSVDIDEDCTVHVDENMIGSVIYNLLVNAIKFSYKNSTVLVFAREEKNKVEVHIQDHGIGIEPENIKLLFDVKSNYTVRGTDNEKGSGLGLILCQDFIRMHKGRIWVKSTYGEGTECIFSIPKK